MKTKEIFDLAVNFGIKSDLRGAAGVKKYLGKAAKHYEKLDKKAKAEFDQEKLSNPYSDSRILVDNNKKEINKILVGIDIDGSELLYAHLMGDFDLVISHHPLGKALADLHSVMDLQAELMAGLGVPINIAESLIKPRISEVSRGVSPINHNRAVDMARLLKLDLLCTHTIADNLGAKFLVDFISRKKPEYVDDVISVLKEIPEFAAAAKIKAGPTVFVGSGDGSCGRVVVTEWTGGTSGAKEMYEKMAQIGIGTIIGMHMKEEHRQEAEKYHINVIIAGHMACDSLGMNLLLDEIGKKGIEIVVCSGLIRHNRKKK